MNKETMKEILNKIEEITFSKEFREKVVKIRNITEDEINKNLRQPDKLILVDDQGEEELGYKYTLLFSKSNKYDLKAVVSVKDKKLNVITSHIQNIKRRKVFEKWLKTQR
jgi:CRISPR/Cas system-associated protein Cas5 (RAMP superfamily)